jgi:WD40 repeat protein
MLSLAFSDDSSLVASFSRCGNCKVWDVKAGKLINAMRHASSAEIGQVIFVSDAHAAALNSPVEVTFWEPTEKGKPSKIALPESIAPDSFKRFRAPVLPIESEIPITTSVQSTLIALPRTILSRDCKTAATTHEGKLYIWDIQGRKIIQAFIASDENFDILALSHKGNQLATGHRPGELFIGKLDSP